MHMKNMSTNIEFVFPKEFNPDNLIRIPNEEPFSDNAIAYLHALAIILNHDSRTRNYSDVMTFAFFCRKANLLELKMKYYPENEFRLGKGLAFHITPSNVPVLFAYSLACGILSGNKNIVKLSSKRSEQCNIICSAIEELSRDKKYHSLSSRFALLRYDIKNAATAYFSSICDARIIWGGDETIAEVRKYGLPIRAIDLTFASRYSICVINADDFIHEKSPGQVAAGFYNDTYQFDQNSCSSPYLIIWLGSDENVETAKKIFWHHVYGLVEAKYNLQPYSAIEKLTTFYIQAAQLEGIKKTDMPDNLVWRVELKGLSKNIDHYRCNGGYFSEYKASSLSELSEIISDKYQTLSYYGITKESVVNFIIREKPGGIDRIVPIGKTSDFSLTWDGFNLIDSLSREITVL